MSNYQARPLANPCRQCKHLKFAFAKPHCQHPGSRLVDYIDGYRDSPQTMRSNTSPQIDRCGPEGSWFEPIDRPRKKAGLLSRLITKLNLAVICVLIAASVLIVYAARGTVQDHPAFGTHHVSQLTVTSDVPDVPKLEAKAIEILRRVGTVTGETMTLAEARSKVRIDAAGNPNPGGRTDVARCIEIVITDRLRGIVQARVTGVRVANEHPVQGGAQ